MTSSASHGYEHDYDRPNAWHYRDWVIDSLNDDLGYDQFLMQQIAGDELAPRDFGSRVATGFCRHGPTVGNQSLEKNRWDELDDVISTTSEVFLGLTIGCARCHDHKYDPITQKDYYSLLAVFRTISKVDEFVGSDQQRAEIRRLDGRIREVRKQEKNLMRTARPGRWSARNGQWQQSQMVPNVRLLIGQSGWTDYRDMPFSAGALHVYYWPQRPEDRVRVADLPWVKFLGGEDPGYPERRLLGELEELRRRMQVVAADDVPADIRMSEAPNALNPVEMRWALVELMQGGIASRHVGVPWHVCVRYFDPVRRRAGIPEDVASLVDRLSADRVELTLVNLDPLRPRELVLQAGAYGEHTIRAATVGAGTEPVAVADRALRVSLAPGAGARICLDVDRYCNDPTLAFPWR